MYTVILLKPAQQFIEKKAPKHMKARLREACQALGRDPYPVGYVKLEGWANRYRIREGDYRIVYRVDREELEVEVIDVDHRKDIYR